MNSNEKAAKRFKVRGRPTVQVYHYRSITGSMPNNFIVAKNIFTDILIEAGPPKQVTCSNISRGLLLSFTVYCRYTYHQ